MERDKFRRQQNAGQPKHSKSHGGKKMLGLSLSAKEYWMFNQAGCKSGARCLPKFIVANRCAPRKPSRGQKGGTDEGSDNERQGEVHAEHITEKGRERACETPTRERARSSDKDTEGDTTHGSRNSGGTRHGDRNTERATIEEQTGRKNETKSYVKLSRFELMMSGEKTSKQRK